MVNLLKKKEQSVQWQFYIQDLHRKSKQFEIAAWIQEFPEAFPLGILHSYEFKNNNFPKRLLEFSPKRCRLDSRISWSVFAWNFIFHTRSKTTIFRSVCLDFSRSVASWIWGFPEAFPLGFFPKRYHLDLRVSWSVSAWIFRSASAWIFPKAFKRLLLVHLLRLTSIFLL